METSLDSARLTQGPSGQVIPSKGRSPFGFVQRGLPWLLAAGFLALYAITLTRWVSYQGLETLARAAGWNWNLTYFQPLHFLVMYPVRWLPGSSQVIGLNLFSAVCSVLTLALLARSVAILPFDRTRDQRQLERNEFSFLSIPAAWLPPVFAVLVCGLQLTFWEHSIVSTTEALDLLLFAYCVRCLLEYRLDQRNSWLYRMALVLGIGITSNYAMLGFAPTFLIAVVWIKKRAFFDARFLLTLAGFAAAGLLLYLVLPAINAFSPLADQNFWQLLKVNLWYQKSQLLTFTPLVVLIPLAAIFFIGIKWPNELGDTSPVGTTITNLMSHVIPAIFMLFCLYVAFDPPFSPRQVGFGRPLLPFYYLGALSVGYFAGYFLLVFGHTDFKPWQRYRKARTLLNRTIVAVVWVAAVAVPVGLVIKNLPEIRKNTAPYLSQMADATVSSLPTTGGVLLSDDSYRLYSVYEALRRKGLLERFICLDSASLTDVAYHRYLRQKHGKEASWLGNLAQRPLKQPMDTPSLVAMLLNAAQQHRVFYLQPSFGYYFESFYLEPHGLTYELKRYPADSVTAPIISPQLLKENDQFWKQFLSKELAALRQPSTIDRPKKDRKPPERNWSTFSVAVTYSRALTWLGVEAQKAGELELARALLNTALELFPDNPSAFVSLDYNSVLRQGKTESSNPSEGALKRLSRYNWNWEQITGRNGPVDDPNACFLVAQAFTRGHNFRQSAQQLYRVVNLNAGVGDSAQSPRPETPRLEGPGARLSGLQARIGLAGVLVQAFFPDKALELINQIRNEPKQTPPTTEQQMGLIQTEAWAYIYKNDLASAEKILATAQNKYPSDDTPFSTLVEIYFRIGQTDKALTVLEQELSRNPNNVAALINSAVIKIQNKQYQAALPLLDRAVNVDPKNAYAFLNRAIVNLNLDRLDDARRDYEQITTIQARVPYTVYYGLGEVAWRQKRPKTALKNYLEYIKTAPQGNAEYDEIQRRIKQLKSST